MFTQPTQWGMSCLWEVYAQRNKLLARNRILFSLSLLLLASLVISLDNAQWRYKRIILLLIKFQST